MSDFIQYFKKEFGPLLAADVLVTQRIDESDSNNLGPLNGVDLDSPRFSGYIYYWGNGFLDFCVFNQLEDKEEISTTVIEANDFKIFRKEILEIVEYFK